MTQTQRLALPEIIPVRADRERRQQDLFSTRATKVRRTYECTWFGTSVPGDCLPNIIVPTDGDLESLFADVATYYREYSPITAYSYVADQETIDSLVRTSSDSPSSFSRDITLDDWKMPIEIALMFAEALSSVDASGIDEGDVSYPACRGSLAFCLARSRRLYPEPSTDRILSKWTQIRELTDSGPRRDLGKSIALISALFGNGTRKELTKVDVDLRRLASRSTELRDFATVLVALYPGISPLLEELRGHFDGRVPAFQKMTERISATGQSQNDDAMAIAFFANLIQPGSIAHTRLVGRWADRYPTVILWYVFFAAVSPEFDFRRAFAGLGSKLERDVETQFQLSSRPISDISLDELIVLSRIGFNARSIKPALNESFLVSLIPGVDVYARFGAAAEAIDRHQIDHLLSTISDRDQHLRRVLQQALGLLGTDFRESSRETSRGPKPPRKFRH